MKPGKKGIPRWINAFQYSWLGLRAAFKYEAAFREETLLALAALPAAFYLGGNALEVVALAGSVLLLMIVELLNSAIEAVVDRIGADYHELSGRAKDMGSAAVLFALILVGLTWGTILLPRIF